MLAAASFMYDQFIQQQDFIFGKFDYLASSTNASLYRFRMRTPTISIFSSSVSSKIGETLQIDDHILGAVIFEDHRLTVLFCNMGHSEKILIGFRYGNDSVCVDLHTINSFCL